MLQLIADQVTISSGTLALLGASLSMFGVVAGVGIAWGSMRGELKSMRESLLLLQNTVTDQTKTIAALDKEVAVLTDRANRPKLNDAE